MEGVGIPPRVVWPLPLLLIAATHRLRLMRRADNEMTLRGGWVVEFVALPDFGELSRVATSRGGVAEVNSGFGDLLCGIGITLPKRDDSELNA